MLRSETSSEMFPLVRLLMSASNGLRECCNRRTRPAKTCSSGTIARPRDDLSSSVATEAITQLKARVWIGARTGSRLQERSLIVSAVCCRGTKQKIS